MGNFQMAFP